MSRSVNLDLSLSDQNRCPRCRSEMKFVAVDAGAGPDLPIFVLGANPRHRSARIVQMVRPPLEGSLCLNCGFLTIQTTLSREELAAYKAQLGSSDGSANGHPISQRDPTWIKSPRGRDPGLPPSGNGGDLAPPAKKP